MEKSGGTIVLGCPVVHTSNTFYEWLKNGDSLDDIVQTRFKTKINGELKIKKATVKDRFVARFMSIRDSRTLSQRRVHVQSSERLRDGGS